MASSTFPSSTTSSAMAMFPSSKSTRATTTTPVATTTTTEAPREEDAANEDDAEVVDLLSTETDDDDDDDDAAEDDIIREIVRTEDNASSLPADVVERIVRRAKGDANRAMELAADALESSALRRAMAASLREAERENARDARATRAAMFDDPYSVFRASSRFIAACSEDVREILFANEDEDEASTTGRRAAVVEFLSIERKCGAWFAAFAREVGVYFEQLANAMGEIATKSGDGGGGAKEQAVLEAFGETLESLKRELFSMPENGAAGAVPAIFSANAMRTVDAVDDDDVVCIAGQNVANQGANEEDVCDLT